MKYLSIREGNFMFIDHLVGPVIESQISIAGKRFIKWGPTGFEGEQICHDETKVPQGWTLAYDLDLSIADEPYRLTIHGGVIEFGFKPYLAQLASFQHSLEDTVTRVSVIIRNGYSLPQFEMAQECR